MNLVQQQELYSTLGERIKDARTKIGMSQEVLGDQLGLTKASIANIEKGRQRPMVHTLLEVAKVFRIQPIDLLPMLDIPPQTNTSERLVASFAQNIISDTKKVDKGTEQAVLKFVSDIIKD